MARLHHETRQRVARANAPHLANVIAVQRQLTALLAKTTAGAGITEHMARCTEMPRTVHSAKKLSLPPISPATAAEVGIPNSSRLFITEQHSKTQYLIDTGAVVSIIPPTNKERRKANNPYGQRCQLYAANRTPIQTYVQRNITLILGLRRKFQWPFVIA